MRQGSGRWGFCGSKKIYSNRGGASITTNMILSSKMRIMAGTALLAATLFAGDQDFTLANKTGFTISALHVAPSKDRTWGDDILGKDELDSGQSLDITFKGYGKKTCSFDIMVKDQDDTEWIIEEVDLCEIHNLTFSKMGKKVVWSAN